ncbi:HAD-IA family hydrolase [Candidatus Pelagibacter communis]|uniref:HAD-IA family hydrolase n=1 Tax=Pelagibacter ubique TaxID=198252 RepID=UPI00094DA7AA|nr:HAD-IA family hydrolase [Candidatus Pelagibacter ubique]
MKNLKEMKYLLLDLDGVCYGSHNGYPLEKVFGLVSKRMTLFIQEKLGLDEKKAKELQTNYFYKYNTSLNGLMLHHNVIGDEFLKYVHDIDISFMKEDKILRSELENLDMEKFIFTNGSAEHAKNILTRLGIYDLFGKEKVFDIKDAGYVPKPEAQTFDLMVKKFGIKPKETIYIEDIAKNLSIGFEKGCTTVWLINDEHFGKIDSDKDYISHKIENLSLFLKEIRLLKSK